MPLPFISIASQAKHIAVYHMALYAVPALRAWYDEEMKKRGLRNDSGKSCLRFSPKKPLPYDLLAQLAAKITPQQWIEVYKGSLKGR